MSSPQDPENKTLISPVTTPGSLDNGVFVTPNYYIPPPKKKEKWYRHSHLPRMLIFISMLQILVHVLNVSTDNKLMVNLRFEPKKQHEPWRFITYMLMHDSWAHLLLNVFPQCLFAFFPENTQACWKILLVYVGGGIGGALGAACMCSDLLVGASAGVYALLASNASYFVLNFMVIKYKKWACAAFSSIILSDILYNVIHSQVIRTPEISWSAHLFGALMGCLIGLLLYADNYEDRSMSKTIKISALGLLVVVITALIVLDVLEFRMILGT